MTKTEVIRKLIDRTRDDFISYFKSPPSAERAREIVELAVSGNESLSSCREQVESMVPDTNDDGSWECSYALNTGLMIISLIDYQESPDEAIYLQAVSLFFESVDFKAQQEMERQGILHPSESEITGHLIYASERAWFKELETEMPNQAL